MLRCVYGLHSICKKWQKQGQKRPKQHIPTVQYLGPKFGDRLGFWLPFSPTEAMQRGASFTVQIIFP